MMTHQNHFNFESKKALTKHAISYGKQQTTIFSLCEPQIVDTSLESMINLVSFQALL
jgi:hypothetical protein